MCSWSWLVSCQLWVWTPSKATVFFLSKKHYPHCLVLVGSRNGFECDFTIKLKYTEGLMDDLLKCQISRLGKYCQNQIHFFLELYWLVKLSIYAVHVLLISECNTCIVVFSQVLGQGWRLGFLGLLHMDVFTIRLYQEFNASVIVTAPSVPYEGRQSKGLNQEMLFLQYHYGTFEWYVSTLQQHFVSQITSPWYKGMQVNI